jgi:CubicO group peptidase (beta-lactamase class C family)
MGQIFSLRRGLGAWLGGLLLCVPALGFELVPLPPQPPGLPWPTRAWPEAELGAGVDRQAFEAALAELFAVREPSPIPDTRALLVVQGGDLVFERYAEGYGPHVRFPSWSMAKSVTQALVGILHGRGQLELEQPVGLAAWSGAGDPRAALTVSHLLHMSSGLGNADGGTDPTSFVAQLLFGPGAPDMPAFAADVPLLHAPGTHWAYSTATSVLLADVVSRTLGGGEARMRAFMREALFAPLGMAGAVAEFDASGHFVGGAYVHASARDWARFGYLYLRDGRWEGHRLLPAGWVDFTRTPAPAPNNGTYGAHFWVNQEPVGEQWHPLPGGPRSAFVASGNGGQLVILVPTRDLVVVRLGELHTQTWPELNRKMAALVAAFPERPAWEAGGAP